MVASLLTGPLKAYIREHPSSWLAMLAQWQRGYSHERDFELFYSLADIPGLVLDIGANRGQSAISLLRNTRKLKVISFEPNKALRHCLVTLKLLHPWRFSYQLIALGESDCQQELWIPGTADEQLHPQASLDRKEFDRQLVAERLAEEGVDVTDPGVFTQRTVNVRQLDGLKLAPDLIKIDAEGSEAGVLAGSVQTLRTHLPAMMVEVNAPESWFPALADLGYLAFRYVPDRGRLEPLASVTGLLNVICLHPNSDSALSKALMSLTD